jgi:hypothetical protein
MNRTLAFVVALAGCDQVYNLTRPPDARVGNDASDANVIDAIDAMPGTCELGPAGLPFPIPAKGVAIGAGKFDNDDNADLVIASSGSQDLLFRFNDNGDFSTASNVFVGLSVLDLAVGDINHDGLDDVAFITIANANAMLQTASSWDRRMVSTVGTPRTISIANFDGANLDDLLVTYPAGQLMQIYFGGALMYTGTNGSIPTTGSNVVDAIAIDVEADGDPDILAAANNENAIRIYRDIGPNFVSDPPIATDTKPVMVAAGHLGDRPVVDLIALNTDGQNATIVRNDGSGMFTPATNLEIGEDPRGLVIADVNADQFADILAVSNKQNRLSVIHGTATGFEIRRDITTVAKPVALALADFTGDGRLDVAVLGEDDGFVIHPSVCAPSLGAP